MLTIVTAGVEPSDGMASRLPKYHDVDVVGRGRRLGPVCAIAVVGLPIRNCPVGVSALRKFQGREAYEIKPQRRGGKPQSTATFSRPSRGNAMQARSTFGEAAVASERRIREPLRR